MEWLSRKAVDYILAPKRGAFNLINPPICSTITAKGQNNWIGTFISPDIDFVEHDVKLGGGRNRPSSILWMERFMSMTESDIPREIKIGNIYGFNGGNFAGNVYDADGICPCLRTFCGGNQQPMVIEYGNQDKTGNR